MTKGQRLTIRSLNIQSSFSGTFKGIPNTTENVYFPDVLSALTLGCFKNISRALKQA